MTGTKDYQPEGTVLDPSVVVQTLIERFDQEELRTLCFHLNVDYDSLPAVGKAAKARELVKLLRRRQHLAQLEKIGRQLRPDIAWDDIPRAADTPPFVPEEAPSDPPSPASRTIYTGGGAYIEGQVEVDRGDFVGRDKTVYGSGDAEAIARAFDRLYEALEAKPDTPEKRMAQQAVEGLEQEAKKGPNADQENVAKWFRFLMMSLPDIGEVAIQTFINPIKGLSTAFQKIAQKAKESQ